MMQQTVNLPRLLDSGWQEVRRVHPLEMSLTMTTKSLSYAVMTLEQDDAEGIAVGAFMELFTNQGSMGVFRVQSLIREEKAVSLELSHAAVTLNDAVIPGEMKEADESLRAALTRLLDAQPVKHWTLGTVAVPDDKTLRWSYAYDVLWEKNRGDHDELPRVSAGVRHERVPVGAVGAGSAAGGIVRAAAEPQP